MVKQRGMTARERATETRQRAIAVCVLVICAAPVLLALAAGDAVARLIRARRNRDEVIEWIS